MTVMTVFLQRWKKDIAAIKSNQALELNVKVDQILKVLTDQNVAYYVCEQPTAFLVHPSNIGGLMLNAFDVHDKGNTMLKVGVQLSKLTDSVAFELSRDDVKRKQQVEKNANLIATSNNMLAPLTGSERYLTVGTSHTVAFCKAVMAGCKTPVNELSTNGCLSLGSILACKSDDHPFKTMCSKGGSG